VRRGYRGYGILLYRSSCSGFSKRMPNESAPPLLPGSKTSPLAVWSLVLGCLGIVLLLACLGPLFAIPAIICGHMAYSRIKRSGGALSGGGMALGGLITGYISIGLSLFLIPMVLAIALPNFVKARQTAQQNVCINNLRRIDSAKQSWALEKKATAEDMPTADDLSPFLGKSFASFRCPAGGTYAINKVGEAPTCTTANHRLPNR
jgi:hypothetical protein